MKKVLAIIFVAVLLLQAGVLTALAETPEETGQVITISDIQSPHSEGESDSSTVIQILGLPSASIEIVSEEWGCPEEITIHGENIEITDGKYSYKLTLRSNGTLTFDNDLEIYYQGINGRYQLNYEIEETDNHIMNVTGTFENIIIESPLLEKLSDKSKNWILSHISDDTYFYQLLLRTAEGFEFTNRLRFLFDSEPVGYNINYTYDLETDEQTLVINGIKDFSEPEPQIPHADVEDTAGSAEPDAMSEPVNEPDAEETKEAEQANDQSANVPEVKESKDAIKPAYKQAANRFAIKDSKRFVKAGRTTLGATVLNSGRGIKTYQIKAVNNKKYAGYFTINKYTGAIKVNPRTPKGKYVVTVQARAAETRNCKASDWKTADVTIIVI